MELQAGDVCAAGIKIRTFVLMAALSRDIFAAMPSFCDVNVRD